MVVIVLWVLVDTSDAFADEWLQSRVADFLHIHFTKHLVEYSALSFEKRSLRGKRDVLLESQATVSQNGSQQC